MVYFSIENYSPEIRENFNNKFSLISTPTGSGKSLFVPRLLAQISGLQVFVTVPRRFIASNLQKAASQIFNERFGCIMHGMNLHTNANVVYCTQQAYLNRLSKLDNHVLVIDEAHEEKLQKDLLLLAAKKAANIQKTVIMSATIDVDKIAEYFGESNFSSLIVEEERQYPIQIKKFNSVLVNDTMIDLFDIDKYQNKRILVGVSGEDDYLTKRAVANRLGMRSFYLHGQMEEWEEKEMLSHSGACIIFATEVAMSGVTIADLDIVIPPMVKKTIVDGKLTKLFLSKAEVDQWIGRVGRVKKGLAIVSEDYDLLVKFPPSEIEKGGEELYKLVIALTEMGVNYEELYNKPDKDMYSGAYNTLVQNNFITAEGSVTNLAKDFARSEYVLEEFCLVQKGRQLGIEATAMKIAEVIKAGNPYRKANGYKFLNELKNKSEYSFSQHMIVIECVEGDDIFFLNPKEYAELNNIFAKGVKLLAKKFKKIDENFRDEAYLTPEILKMLFEGGLKSSLFQNRNGYLYNGKVYAVDTYKNNKKIVEKAYVSLSPVVIKRGMLSNLMTYL